MQPVPKPIVPEPRYPFAVWLREQLKVAGMSQRQLAYKSGIDHSTISRILTSERQPTYETAIRLAVGLRALGGDLEPVHYLRLPKHGMFPTVRVEHALRGDALLTPAQVSKVMRFYLMERMVAREEARDTA